MFEACQESEVPRDCSKRVRSSKNMFETCQKFQERFFKARQKFQEHVRSVASRACQMFQEHVSSVSEVPTTCYSSVSEDPRTCERSTRQERYYPPTPHPPQPQEYAKMYKNAKGVYLRASNYNTTLHNTTLHYTILRYTIYTTPQLQPHDTTRLHTHTTLDYTTLYYTRVHYTTVHYTTLPYTTFATLQLQLH